MANEMSISNFLTRDDVSKKIKDVVGQDSERFVTSLVSAVTTNAALNNCSRESLFNAALLGQALKLSPSPQLGHFYMVPFKDQAQFVLGWKGYIQLAVRSGQYKRINAMPVKAGELQYFDEFNEEIKISQIEDPEEREKAETIGYFAMFELTNGFRKAIYWSRERMERHAVKYSQGYAADKRKGNSYTFWSKDFDGMAIKTMIRQLIGKWGIMSIEMVTAYESDGAAIYDDGRKAYPDNREAIAEEIEQNANQIVIDIEAEDAEPNPKKGGATEQELEELLDI